MSFSRPGPASRHSPFLRSLLPVVEIRCDPPDQEKLFNGIEIRVFGLVRLFKGLIIVVLGPVEAVEVVGSFQSMMESTTMSLFPLPGQDSL